MKDDPQDRPLPRGLLALQENALKAPLFTKVAEALGISRAAAIAAVAFCLAALAGAVVFCIHSAPSHVIRITCGPEGSVFYTTAQKYAKVLARQGVRLKIETSRGSLENLQRLGDRSHRVDVGFVQDGLAPAGNDRLVSLGSISYQPLLVFYRGTRIDSLAALAGRKLAIGQEGSGTRTLATTLLEANGIAADGPTAFLALEPQEASTALLAGKVDAVFLMGEDASVATMRELMRSPEVQLLDFPQAEAYTRRFGWLSVLKLPEGSIDFGKNIPAGDVHLVGPTIELVARKDLHPALSDLLLEAAQEVNGNATLLQRKGEFPSPMEHDFHISADAARFYRSGKSFFYHYLPFWLASLTSRIVVVFIPTVVVLIPILRSIPQIYRWRVQSQIYRWYRAMLALERELFDGTEPKDPQTLLARLDAIEAEVSRMKVPAFFAEQFYALRGHIGFVRQLIGKQSAGH